MPPVTQRLQGCKKFPLMGWVVLLGRIQLFRHAGDQLDLTRSIGLAKRSSHRKLTGIQVDQILLRGVMESKRRRLDKRRLERANSQAKDIKLDLGLDIPKLRAGCCYFLWQTPGN